MSGGRKAREAGEDLENKVAAIGRRLKLQVMTKYKVGKRLWGSDREIDVVLIHRKTRKTLGIECKSQSSGGSLDQKVPTTIKDIEAWPIEGIVVISGEGFSPRMRSFLHSTGKVVELEDLETWLRLYFGLKLTTPAG